MLESENNDWKREKLSNSYLGENFSLLFHIFVIESFCSNIFQFQYQTFLHPLLYGEKFMIENNFNPIIQQSQIRMKLKIFLDNKSYVRFCMKLIQHCKSQLFFVFLVFLEKYMMRNRNLSLGDIKLQRFPCILCNKLLFLHFTLKK